MSPKITTESDRFRAFAQRIISVPKAEVDRRAKAEKKRSALRKAKA